jgi:hypothetical protein
MPPLVVPPLVVTVSVGQGVPVVQALHAVTAALQVQTTRGGNSRGKLDSGRDPQIMVSVSCCGTCVADEKKNQLTLLI